MTKLARPDPPKAQRTRREGVAALLRRGPLLGLSLALSAVPSLAQQECRVMRYGVALGSDTTEYMTVKSGGSCSQSVTAPWAGFGASQSIELRPIVVSGLSLVARAQHGNAGTNGTTFYAYKARPGYVGPDRFVVLARGPGGSSRITVQVTVVP